MTLNIKRIENNAIEIWEFSEGGGPIIRCYPDGRIELFEVPQYGGEECFIGNYPTVCAALEEGESWT